ncbi:MAG: leucine-rich repeat domain-containing protein, partial [Oscillospiraceae bacterium]
MGLSNITYLDADHNNIADFTAVSAMTSMEELWLSYNDIDSIKPLTKLKALKRLGLKGTGLDDADLNTLKGIKTLTELAIEDNTALSGEAVDSLQSALSGCTISHSDLVFTVTLGGTAFESDAESVSASGTGVTSIKGLDKFSGLKTLQLTNTSVSDLSPLSGLDTLETLEIWSGDSSLKGNVTDITALKDTTTLKIVNLMWNSVTDISPLAASTGITELYLTGNDVSNIAALSGMKNLKELALDNCPVGNITPLSALKNLTSLSLQDCGLTDLTAIKGLTGLRELYLDNNKISDLTPLTGLSNLHYLYICDNKLTADQVRELQEALPDCSIYTDLDMTKPEETAESQGAAATMESVISNAENESVNAEETP